MAADPITSVALTQVVVPHAALMDSLRALPVEERVRIAAALLSSMGENELAEAALDKQKKPVLTGAVELLTSSAAAIKRVTRGAGVN